MSVHDSPSSTSRVLSDDSSHSSTDRTPLLAKHTPIADLTDNKTLSFGTDSTIFKSWQISSTSDESPKPINNFRRWLSIYIMYFTMFLASLGFTIIVSSVWPYLNTVSPSSDKTFYGFVVGVFSFGQLIGSPIFGYWGNIRPMKEPLLVSLIIFSLANILYSFCDAFPDTWAGWMMLVSRFLIGLGAGNVSVVRAYVAAATTEKERTGVMATISACQALGFILGPVFGLAFAFIKYPGLSISAIKFTFNIYTGPGFLSATLAIVNIIALFFFKEIRIFSKKNNFKGKKSSPTQAVKYSNSPIVADQTNTTLTLPRYDILGAIVCIFLFFSIFLVFTVFETIGTPLSMDQFAWTKEEATKYNNIVYAGMGVIAVIMFIIITLLAKRLQERTIFIGSLFILSLAFYSFIPWKGPAPLPRNEDISNSSEPVGCDYIKQPWCAHTPALNLAQYIIGSLFISIGFPAAQVMSYTIYSKILGPFPQGTMMGVLTAFGSLARTLGPIFVSQIYILSGPQITFAVFVGYIAFVIIIAVLTYKRLVPYKLTGLFERLYEP